MHIICPSKEIKFKFFYVSSNKGKALIKCLQRLTGKQYSIPPPPKKYSLPYTTTPVCLKTMKKQWQTDAASCLRKEFRRKSILIKQACILEGIENFPALF